MQYMPRKNNPVIAAPCRIFPRKIACKQIVEYIYVPRRRFILFLALPFIINGRDARDFGSQGQQRTAALSLKLSEIELVKRMTKDTPILLLDDVLSELDSSRQNYLLNSIGEIQTIITCTGLDEFVRNRFEINRVFQVVNGTVSAGRNGGTV